MTEFISQCLSYVSGWFSLLPAVIGLVLFKYLKKSMLPALFIALTAALTELIIFLFLKAGKDPWIINMLYTLAEFTFLIMFYYEFLKPHLMTARFILLLIPLFCMLSIGIYLSDDEKLYGSYSTSIESVIISLFGLGSFVFVLRKMLFKNILSEPFFYFNTGFLFYFLGNLAFFGIGSYIKQIDPSSYASLRIIHSILNISLNLLMSIGFWKAKTVWE